MTALVRKELRELAGVAGAALAAYLALVVSLTGSRLFDWIPGMPEGTREVPFLGLNFLGLYAVISLAFAVGLGLRQTLGESLAGTWLFLLHRPARRSTLFLTKLAVGLGVLLVVEAVPILLYGAWAATPGTHPSPFAWWWTLPAWRTALMTTAVYLAAFLTGLRPAWWLGSRLAPLAAAVVFVPDVFDFWESPAGPVVLLAFDAVAVLAIVRVGRDRDYA